MQSLATNGFTADQVNNAIRAASLGMGEFRFRFELLDSDNNFIRDLTGQSILGGSVHHVSGATIKRAATLTIRERTITLDDYPDLVVSDEPLFLWQFNEASGATAQDSSPNNRDGTIANMAYASEGLLGGHPELTSFTFNGTSSVVQIASAAWMNVSQFSAEAWIKTTASGTNQHIIGRDNGNGWIFRLHSGGTLRFFMWNGATYDAFLSTVALNDGLPHHVAVTYDGVYVTLWADGVRILHTAESSTFPTPAVDISVGVLNAAEWFSGQIQMVAVWGRALSALEIREHWQQGSGDLSEIDFERDRIRIFCAVKMEEDGDDDTPWAEAGVGLFLLSSPDREQSRTGITRQVECYDQTKILDDDCIISDRYVLNPQNYITAITTVLQSSGLDTTGYSLQPTSLSLPVQRAWPIGTTKLQIVNDLLASINYRKFRFSGSGVGIAEENVLPEDRAVEYEYSTAPDTFSIVAPDMTLSLDLAVVPNRVVLFRGHPKLGNLTGIATNNNFYSPVSVIRRGDHVKVWQNQAVAVDAPDQTTIDAMAVQKLSEVSQPSQTWRFKSALNPFHDDQDKYTLDDTTGKYNFDVSGDFLEDEWILPLDELGLMEHVARRVIAVS